MTFPVALGRTLAVCGAFLLVGCGRPPIPTTTEVKAPSPKTQDGNVAEGMGSLPDLPSPKFAAGDWPGWRGPNHDGLAPESVVPTEWSETQNVVWKVKLPGRGHSSPVVLGDRIYLETADDPQQIQSVLAVDRQRGKLLWKTDLHEGHLESAMHAENTQASSTLATDGERLFAAFLNNHRIWCSALSLEGEELWREEVGGFQSRFGYSGSPFVYRSLVILSADHESGGFIAALHRETGKIVWRRKRANFASYASPRLVTLGGVDQVILCGGGFVTSYDPLSGEELWSTKGTTESTVGTAVVSGDLVIVTGGYPGAETVALKGDGTVAWRIGEKSYVPSLLAYDGSLYLIKDDVGVMYCFDAGTGKERWKKRLGGRFRSSPVLAGQNIYVTDMAGKTTVFKANPEQFELVAENQLGNEGFSSPAISGDQLFLRVPTEESGGRTEYLYCLGAPKLSLR